MLLGGSCAGVPVFAAPVDTGRVDRAAAAALQAFDVPGIAVAMVVGGEPVLSRGYGVREKGRRAAVDEYTLFQIGSLTKAFTAVAIALLVDEGKLGWDDKVADHLPAFRMYDPYVTREMTVRDLLTHRSGLGQGAGDLLFWPNATGTRQDVMRALRHLQPVSSFRSRFAYNNLMYVVAAEVVEAAAGLPWEAFVERRIFAALGMRDCAATYERSVAKKNHARPHMPVNGELVPTFFSPGQVMSAAGAINCSAHDLAIWMSMLVAGGRAAGARLLDTDTVAGLWASNVALRPDSRLSLHAQSDFRHYGLGWFVSDYRDTWLAEHGGTIHGASARIVLLPEREFGVVVVANGWAPITRALALQIVEDSLFGGDTDWLSIYREPAATEPANAAGGNDGAPNEPSGSGCNDIGAGDVVFRDPWYGDVVVSQARRETTIDFLRTPALQGPLECVSGDRFIARWADRTLAADAYVTLDRGFDGRVAAMRVGWVDPDTDFSYDFHNLDLRRVEPADPR